MSKELNLQQSIEQAGFQRGFSTYNHLQTINQLIGKTTEYQLDLHLTFVDYRETFDFIKHNYILKALKNKDIPSQLIKIIQNRPKIIYFSII